MKNLFKKYLINIIIILGLTVAALWFTLKDNYQEILVLVSNIKWYWLLMILVWGLLYSVVVGKILSLFAQNNKKDYTLLQGIQNGLVGSFFSGVTPSATGGQFAQAYIFKKQGLKVSDGASILWADFIVYQTTMMVYVSILFFLRMQHYLEIFGILSFIIIFGFFINLCVIAILWTMALCPKLYFSLSQKTVRLLARIHIVKDKEKTLESWGKTVKAFTKEIAKLRHETVLIAKTVVWNILRMTMHFSLPFFIANAIGINIGFESFVDCLALAAFVLMANSFIPIPGASGGTEYVFVQLYIYIVGSYVNASSIMILWRFSTFHVVMIVGGIIFVYLKHKYSKNKKEDISILDEEIQYENSAF